MTLGTRFCWHTRVFPERSIASSKLVIPAPTIKHQKIRITKCWQTQLNGMTGFAKISTNPEKDKLLNFAASKVVVCWPDLMQNTLFYAPDPETQLWKT